MQVQQDDGHEQQRAEADMVIEAEDEEPFLATRKRKVGTLNS